MKPNLVTFRANIEKQALLRQKEAVHTMKLNRLDDDLDRLLKAHAERAVLKAKLIAQGADESDASVTAYYRVFMRLM